MCARNRILVNTSNGQMRMKIPHQQVVVVEVVLERLMSKCMDMNCRAHEAGGWNRRLLEKKPEEAMEEAEEQDPGEEEQEEVEVVEAVPIMEGKGVKGSAACVVKRVTRGIIVPTIRRVAGFCL